tara:strand:+ start:1066 stop:2379 length:1314 start_codon:yes stop_codon:yes gene_type:complete
VADIDAISEIGSERATVGDGNKIVTWESKVHVVWQDISRDGYLNQVRSFDQAAGTWSETVTLGKGLDNHARPILSVDHDGYLHVVLGGHNSPVTWRRSVRPNDSSFWTDPEPTGEGTYPVLLCGPDNTLYLTLRANRHAGVDFYVRPSDGSWSRRSRIVANAPKYREAYAAFHTQMMMGPDGVIHAAVDFYEGQDDFGRGLHMAVTYCKSADGGMMWMTADGRSIDLPGRPEQMDLIAQSTERRVEPTPRVEHANCGVLVDSRSRPHVVFLSHRAQPGELFLVAFDETGRQTRQPIHPHLESKWPGLRVTEARGSILVDDTIYLLVTLSPYNHEWIKGRPSRAMWMSEREDQRLVYVKTTDFGATCEVLTVVEPGVSINAPNLEVPVGANRIGSTPTFAYFDGTRGYPGGEEYYNRPVDEMLREGAFTENRVMVVRG